jgi:KipI family sensor histidine kinase inhibitor
MSSPVHLRCVPYGEAAILIRTIGGDPEERWCAVRALARAARESAPGSVVDAVAAYDSLLIKVRTSTWAHADVERWVRSVGEALGMLCPQVARVIEVPVAYGGFAGPDLEAVARELELTPDELVGVHCSRRWTIRTLGSPAGAPMMDGGAIPGEVTRREEPRIAVPAGSVALAGRQCVIYPVRSPGGWRLIGRTPLQLVDLTQTPPTQYRPGDVIRFRPMVAREWDALEGAPLRIAP